MIATTPTTPETIHASKVFKPCNRNTIECPTPGVYSNDEYSMTEYHAIEAVNASTLKPFIESGLHGKLYLEGKQDPPSNSMLLGTAAHARLFEREDYENRAIDGKHPSDKGKTLADSCAWSKHKAVQDENPDNIILHAGWSERIEGIANEIESQPDTINLFRDPDALREVTLIWHETMTVGDIKIEIPFKARLDYLNTRVPCIVDLKTTTDPCPRMFQKTIVNFGYHISAGVYTRGCLKLGLMERDENGRPPALPYIAIAAATKAPFIATPYPMPIESVMQGWHEAKEIGLRRLAKYRVTGEFEYPVHILDGTTYSSRSMIPLGLPEWAMDEHTSHTI